jgi:23S rRNA pseudouridine2605 synthase
MPSAEPLSSRPPTRPETETGFTSSAFDPAPDAPPPPAHVERLQKVLANAGLGSRRLCEGFIADGIVTVDGKVATLGDKVDPSTAVIHINGQRVVTDTRVVYLAMNKPRGVVSTMDDDRGRRAVVDYIGEMSTRVFHVGRLDADSEGLLLLTNDGTLAHKLMHPSYEIAKTYRCEITGPVPRALGRELKAGIELEDGPAKVDEFRVVDAFGRSALVELVLHEGRNRQVRRMCAALGHPVSALTRTAFGPLRLGRLRPGARRRLSAAELQRLREL